MSKQLEVTTRTVEFTTFRVEVEDDFDMENFAGLEDLPVEGYPEIHSEVSDWKIVEVLDRRANRRVSE